MRLEEFYNFVIQQGKVQDPRGSAVVEINLRRTEEQFKKLNQSAQKVFEKDRLTNPYADTKLLCGDLQAEIKTILVGIDIEVAEILLADRLKQKGENIDLVLAHHPAGSAYANFYEVMDMQADILAQRGVPINVAEHLLEKRIKEVERKVMPANHMRVVDAAKLLNIPLVCAHTVADNHVATYLQKLLEQSKVKYLDEVLKIIKEIPEYREADSNNNPPRIFIGKETNRCGKIFVDMTGGTEGSVDIYEKLAQAGIGTIIAMHLSEKHTENAQKAHLNVIVAGHIPSDNLGLNLLLDSVEKKFPGLKVSQCSGFRRFCH